jgi:hypothetical protein
VKIDNRQQMLAIVAIAAVALLLGDKLIVTPLTKSWKARSTRIADLKKSIDRGKQMIEREQNLRSRWESMVTNTLPSTVSAAENQVLKAFDRWSDASRVTITGIKPQWKRTDEDYLTLECRADASGTIQSLTRFLYEVEQDPLALKVEAIEITARDNDGQQLALGLQVSGLLLNEANANSNSNSRR